MDECMNFAGDVAIAVTSPVVFAGDVAEAVAVGVTSLTDAGMVTVGVADLADAEMEF